MTITITSAIDVHSDQARVFVDRYETLGPYDSPFSYSRMRLAGLLSRHLPASGDNQMLLDVGCGTGHHLRALRERNYAVTGVDGSPEMLAHARASNPDVPLELSDVSQLPFPDESFDIVICIEVLRYLRGPGPVCPRVARVLRPGGLAL